jgi:uncharacterized protein YoxC
MLRESFKKNLVDILEKNTDLYGEDFEFIESQNDINNYNLRLEYIFNHKFYFNIQINVEEIEFEKEIAFLGKTKDKKEINTFICSMCPGSLFNNHEEKAMEIAEITEIYSEWSSRVCEDIKATSIYGKINRLNVEFEELKKKFNAADDEYFKVDEAQKIIDRLTELEDKLSQHINSNDDEATKIKKDIENLSSDLYSMTKNNWFKKFFSRFGRWIINPKNQEIIMSTANNIKQLIDSDK